MAKAFGLREGVRTNRFLEYVASLQPEQSFLNIEEISPRSCTEIDVGALLDNLKYINALAAEYGNETMAIIKSDGYGHGAVIVARLLHQYRGINFFGVATVTEALELRAAGLTDVRILIVGPVVESEWKICTVAHLDVIIDSVDKIDPLLSWAETELFNDPSLFVNPENHLKVHVKLNTGMNRIGLGTFDASSEGDFESPESDISKKVEETIGHIVRLVEKGSQVGIKFEALYTHMCDAENKSSYTEKQLGRFKLVVDGLRAANIEIPILHVANSDTLLSKIINPEQWKQLVGGSKSYNRTGGAMYGLKRFKEITQVLTFKSQIRYISFCEKGMSVGYDRTWTAPEDCIIGTMSVGYGDGYMRLFSNRGTVGVRGHIYPIAGNVCMDMTMINLGPPDGPGSAVQVGDYATLYGLGGPSIDEISADLKTCEYDLTSNLSRRTARHYVNLPPDVDSTLFKM